MTDEIPKAYSGEAMLLRWGDSHKGRTVTFQLDEHVGEQHPFKGMKIGENGQRLKMVCVLIDDHEQPLEPEKAKSCVPKVLAKTGGDAAPTKSRTPFKELPRSQQAAIKCGDSEFQNWIIGKFDMIGLGVNGARADETLKRLLNITSKKELDTNPEKAEALDRLMTDFDLRHSLR